MYGGGELGTVRLPLVAAGKPLTVEFGVDSQLQVSRILVDKTRNKNVNIAGLVAK